MRRNGSITATVRLTLPMLSLVMTLKRSRKHKTGKQQITVITQEAIDSKHSHWEWCAFITASYSGATTLRTLQ